MLKIDLVNVQAIGEAHIEIEDNSIVEFVGDNSNGKSIVSKIIEAVTSGDVRDKATRESLIKDYTEHAVAIFTYGTKQLGVILKSETRDSFIMYNPDASTDEGRVLRNVNDAEGCRALIYEFGFRTYSEGDICLQLAPTFGAIPFVTTKGNVNKAIVEDITVDKIADEFLKTFQTITFPGFKSKVAYLRRERDSAQTILDNMDAYDWHAYEEIAERMKTVYDAIANYSYHQIDSIPIPPMDTLPAGSYVISKVPAVDFYDYAKPIVCVTKALEDYIQIMDGVCPTCGKPLVEHTSQHSA